MPSAELSASARQALIALLLSGQQVTNPMLMKRFNLDLKKSTRDVLIKAGLVELTGEKISRAMVFRLTEKGRTRAAAELATSAPDGTGYGVRLLYAVANVLNSVMQQYGLDVEKIMQGEIDQPAVPRPGRPPVGEREQGLEGQILSAYAALTKRSGDLVSLVRLRQELASVDRAELDKVLKAMDRSRAIQLEPEPNRKVLSDDAHEAAIRIGGEDKHFISVGHR